MKVCAVVIALALTGCYNLIVVNVGVANKSASADAAPFNLEAYCAALTAQLPVVKGPNGAQIDPQAAELCQRVAAREGKK
jgi:hypothetical protein